MEAPKRDGHDPRWDGLGVYFRALADDMGLHQWYFDISRDAPAGATHNDEEAYASIFVCSQAVSATLRIGDSFWSAEPYYQRWALVHELIHVIEAPYIKALEEVIDAPGTSKNIVNQLRERFIDQLALMLAPMYKEPPKDFASIATEEMLHDR
jgi:hypothetical protein